MALTVEQAKTIINEVIIKTEKSIEKEVSYQKELADDNLTYQTLLEMEAASEPLPEGCPYKDYAEWKKQIEDEIKSSESSIARIGIEKAELMAFKYFVENATEV